jgi:hypothetical protein
MNNVSKHQDLTIVINTCDTYEDVLVIFFHAFNAHWPDCPYPVVINTESNKYQHPARVHNHHSPGGTDDWGARLLSTLRTVESEFVLMVYDDFILDCKVNNDRVTAALLLMKSQAQATVAYLIDTALPLSTPDSTQTFVEIKARADYRLNSAPGIWRRQNLMSYTAAGDTPWAWEVFGTYRTWGDGKDFYSLNPQQADIYPYNHAKGGAIYRGKWVREVVEQVSQAYPLKINWEERGYSSDKIFEKRSIAWKLRFLETGFRMVGWKVIYFLMGYIRDKINAR